MKRKSLFLSAVLLISSIFCRADEGMWIPMLLKKYNIEEMQKKGFRLTAEDIYNINQASLKDAVVGLGRAGRPFAHFCTGDLVSNEGLMISNHHCAFDMIQSHSSLEHNYLKDGFWAKNKGEELANPGITASILVRMEDVTDKVMNALTPAMNADEKENAINKICGELEQKAVKGSHLLANIKPYFNGNQYFMSVYKIYKDVRLVGAPPSAIGKFGGDTDNWMWPRHTGDFSVLRIYADKNNEPADFSVDNQPYQPRTFFKISTRGVKEGDFTMVFGYPGTTNEYLTSYAVQQIQDIENPHKIGIRTAKLNVMNASMESDELLRIKYASKAASVANAWKKWQGEVKGLKRFNTVTKKQQLEKEFQDWAKGKEQYNQLLDKYKSLYNERENLILAASYLNEAGLRGAEIIGWTGAVYRILTNKEFQSDSQKYKEKLKLMGEEFYKDYDWKTDRNIMLEMLKLYHRNLPKEWIPKEIQNAAQKNIEQYCEQLYIKSAVANEEHFLELIEHSDGKTWKKMKKDPVHLLLQSINQLYNEKIGQQLNRIENEIKELNQQWLAGLMEMQPEKVFYADANSTLRVSYGVVQGYSPNDAVYYKHFTTLKGIIEKDNPEIYDYNVPQRLRDIYSERNFGSYTQEGEIPVCFIATNHTTGGNSGSPVLNADGHLIGLNFDRAWDGVMSDIQYDAEICRNISVDIRYVLFMIDKLAGANHLIEEMDIVE